MEAPFPVGKVIRGGVVIDADPVEALVQGRGARRTECRADLMPFAGPAAPAGSIVPADLAFATLSFANLNGQQCHEEED